MSSKITRITSTIEDKRNVQSMAFVDDRCFIPCRGSNFCRWLMVISANDDEEAYQRAGATENNRIILEPGQQRIAWDSRVNTVMLMVYRLGEYGSGCIEPINTNMWLVMPTRSNQINLRASITLYNPSEGWNHKAPTLREVDSGSFVHTTSTTTRYDTYSCVCVCCYQ